MKKFACILGFLLVFCFTFGVNAASLEDTRDVANLFLREPSFSLQENLTEHDNFPWHWIVYSGMVKGNSLFITSAEYQVLVSPGEQLTVWWFIDYLMDGVIDNWARRFYIKDKDDIILMPEYPEQFHEAKWNHPPREEAQAEFDKIIRKLNRKEL